MGVGFSVGTISGFLRDFLGRIGIGVRLRGEVSSDGRKTGNAGVLPVRTASLVEVVSVSAVERRLRKEGSVRDVRGIREALVRRAMRRLAVRMGETVRDCPDDYLVYTTNILPDGGIVVRATLKVLRDGDA